MTFPVAAVRGGKTPVRAAAAPPPVGNLPAITTTGATLWTRLEADSSGGTDAALLTTWTDQTANAFAFTGSGAARPTYYAKEWPFARPALTFTAANSSKMQAASAADWKYLHDGTAWTMMLAWRTLQGSPSGTYTLLDTGGSATNRIGLCVKWNATSAQLEVTQTNGVANLFDFTANSVAVRSSHGIVLTFDGATLSAWDWDTSLGTAVVSGSPSASNPTYPATLGIDGAGSNPFDGELVALVILKGAALNTADRGAWTAYLESKWHPAGTVQRELLLDSQNYLNASGVSKAIISPTKYGSNPTFDNTNTGSEWDYQKDYICLDRRFGASDFRRWYSGNDSPLTAIFNGYATSSDGLTWTKPNLGNVGSTNILYQPLQHFVSVLYDPTALRDDQLYLASVTEVGVAMAQANQLSFSRGGQEWPAYNSPLQITLPGSLNPEAANLVKRADGRIASLYETHNDANGRGAGLAIANSTTTFSTTKFGAALWTDYGQVVQATNSTHQINNIDVLQHGPLWIGTYARWGTSTSAIYLAISRDEGHTWEEVSTNWLAMGTAGQWDAKWIYDFSWLKIGSTWYLHYIGQNVNPNTIGNSAVGRATLTYARLAAVTSAGTFNTRGVYASGQALVINADGTGGSVTVALLNPTTGAAIPGYGHGDFTAITMDSSGTIATWGAHTTLPDYLVRLQFKVNGSATLYSYRLLAAGGVPEPPLWVGASQDTQTATVGVRWEESDLATSYNVYYSATSGGSLTSLATGVTDLFYNDTTVSLGVKRYYKVTAVSAAGESAVSMEATGLAVAYTTNLAASYLCAEADGTTRNDSSPNANNLTDHNTVTKIAGQIGSGVEFVAASSQALTKTANSTILLGANDWTLTLWFNSAHPGGGDYWTIASKGSVSPRHGIGLALWANGIDINIGNGSSATTITYRFVDWTAWTFLVVQRNAATGLLTITTNNGNYVESTTLTGTVDDSTFPLVLGAAGNVSGSVWGTGYDNYATAKISQPSLWISSQGGGALLNASQLAAIYARGVGSTYPWSGVP